MEPAPGIPAAAPALPAHRRAPQLLGGQLGVRGDGVEVGWGGRQCSSCPRGFSCCPHLRHRVFPAPAQGHGEEINPGARGAERKCWEHGAGPLPPPASQGCSRMGKPRPRHNGSWRLGFMGGSRDNPDPTHPNASQRLGSAG